MIARPRDKKSMIDIILSIVLLVGLLAALIVTAAGGILLMMQEGDRIIHFRLFKGEPGSLTQLTAVVSAAVAGDPASLTQLGILIMIATPIARVLSCVILFLVQRDLLYIGFSSLVLVILLFSFFSHL